MPKHVFPECDDVKLEGFLARQKQRSDGKWIIEIMIHGVLIDASGNELPKSAKKFAPVGEPQDTPFTAGQFNQMKDDIYSTLTYWYTFARWHFADRGSWSSSSSSSSSSFSSCSSSSQSISSSSSSSA